jgi:hypothetical protein
MYLFFLGHLAFADNLIKLYLCFPMQRAVRHLILQLSIEGDMEIVISRRPPQIVPGVVRISDEIVRIP